MSGNIIIGKAKIQMSASNLYLGDPFHMSYNPESKTYVSEEIELTVQQSEADFNLEIVPTKEYNQAVENLKRQAIKAGFRIEGNAKIVDFRADERPEARPRARCNIM